MPIFSDADWTELGTDLTDLYDGPGTVYRAGTTAGGTAKVGAMTAVGTAQMSIYARQINGRLFAPDTGLGGGRVAWEASVLYSASVLAADEIRARGVRYKVKGVADLRASLICDLEELRS